MANRKLHTWIRQQIVGLLPVLLLASHGMVAQVAVAQDFEYPELSVAPRASERLQMELANPPSLISAQWPIQVSALATLTAGAIHFVEDHPDDDPDNKIGWAGAAVGGGWLIGTALLHAMYDPYEDALKRIKSLPTRTKREQLVRERMAEEAIESAARTANRVAWISFGSNFAANLVMIANSDGNSETQISSALGMVTSVLPLIFSHRWETVAREQRDYKKKIYSPVASFGLLQEPGAQDGIGLAPGLNLAWRF